MSKAGFILAGACAVALAACTTGGTTASPTLKDCPTGAGNGLPAGQQGPGITFAKSVASSDNSTSTVIKPGTGPQIQCGRTELQTHNDVVFSRPAQLALKMDVQVPKTAGVKPLVVYVTGGGFVMAPKESGLKLRTYVAEAGFVVASIQYRTITNGATYIDGVADVKSAIRYLRAHAGEYGIDPNRVAVWGESAGGYLVSMVGTTNGLKQFDVGDNLDQSSSVQAVIDKFGASDLSKTAADFDLAAQQAYAGADNPLAQYVNGPGSGKALRDDPAAVAKANPITYIHAGDPPFLLFHGNADKIMSPSQTLLLHNALRAAGVSSTRYVVDGAGHGDLAVVSDPAGALPWSTQEVANHMVDFLKAKS